MMENSKKVSLIIKYSFDKLLSILILIVTSPIFLVVAIILKIKGEDVFFLQKRVGYLGDEFTVYKFTTMPKGSEKFGYITTIKDSRPTKFGKILRKTKVNELPQLFNILIGNMSLIGPRPLIKAQISESFTEAEIINYYQMRPGISGAASLYFHDEDRILSKVQNPKHYYNEVIMPKKKQIEKEYMENWNLILDCKIFFLTVKTLFIGTVKI